MTTPSRTRQGRDRAGASSGRTGASTPASERTPGLQEALGNQALLQLLSSGALQAKLNLSQLGDPLEAEADRVAREVVSRPVATALPRRTWEDAPLAAAEPAPANAPPAVPAVVDTLRSAGQPLDPGTRDFMEDRFGRDFGIVRVHT
ncbi:MAG TPA: hypothetical protein VLQ45_15050, partial [Thermoanaerobaculia bacterium]|nr:hypothetical protein [Thermoanaerobaculia bacterium]